MPISKNALRRHFILDECFSNFGRKYFIEDLMEKCDGISRRQIFEDIDFFISTSGWDAPLEKYKDGKRTYYRYSNKDFTIRNRPITDEEMLQLQATVDMLSRFHGLPQFDLIQSLIDTIKSRAKIELKSSNSSVISLQSNEYVAGTDFISELFNYIFNKTPIKVEYQTFHKGKRSWIIHPYYLKQYNNRWFLIGLNDEYRTFTHIGLDRIQSIEAVNTPYITNEQFDSVDEYFEDIVGVSIPDEQTIEHVVLKFSNHRYPYVKAKPIHGSQKVADDENGLITLDIMLNKELESILLSFGEDVEVIGPMCLRKQISEKIKSSYDKYFSMQ